MMTFKMFFTAFLVVLVAVVIDVALLHRQATRGDLPFRVQLLPKL